MNRVLREGGEPAISSGRQKQGVQAGGMTRPGRFASQIVIVIRNTPLGKRTRRTN